MIGKMFKSLFGGSGEGAKTKSEAMTVAYQEYLIIAEPRPANGQWQVSGRIEKQVGDTTRTHTFIRADTLPDETGAANEMVRKAKMMIDQQGDSIFD
ncbi:HlyU family transcriptional regulator [Roseibium salinum]|uniref:HlyU family transcriptional regulator n=1 Tax=Roseibium salinum TaxID=1604349 RepID=A0ABT3QXS0_9HYPH|nr:HlyU family transcriptional regulator [Roseibium sp. DSM 29163]MCX2721651.1 HlyU family transcriptional regulator [Roseibium sp. DSM 29163]MDN3720303.1 HlyU family transcriptional regulator [Roseibium salinum]